MQIIRSISRLRKKIKPLKQKNSIGFVPTMGALHEGHLSLLRRARRENGITILSIFVNPAQFGPKEDFSTYPRPENKDILLAKKENVDIIFYPSAEEMYPAGFLTFIEAENISQILCGQSRPSHFRGVTTVVGKLLNLIAPDKMYLGQKDAQQAFILKKMAEDLNYDVKVVICPTRRDKDGLALSSRNQYLTGVERKEAPIIYNSLRSAKLRSDHGEKSAAKIKEHIRKNIQKHSTSQIDYIECVDAATLGAVRKLQGKIMIAVAVRFGKTRLIDNIIFNA